MKGPLKRSQPFFKAAEAGDIAKVESILDQGEYIDPRDRRGMTPLMHAISRRHTKLALLLIKRGADVSASSPKCQTPLCYAAMQGDLKVAKQLFKKGANVDQVGLLGETPAMHAAESGQLEFVELLIQAGCNLNTQSREAMDKLTAIMMADPSRLDIVKLLLKHGADPNIQNDLGQTASEHALSRAAELKKLDDPETVQLFIKKAELLKKHESRSAR